jgi:CRP-like cAMP-binding protein
MQKEALKRYGLFASMEDAQIEDMLAGMRVVPLEAGAFLFRQGDPAQRFFVLESGVVKLFRLSPDGDEKVIEVIKAGESFAEAVMFMEANRYPVNAQTLAESRALAFENRRFYHWVKTDSALALRLLGSLSRRMHALVKEIDELTLHNAGYRLVNYLLNEAGEDSDGDITLSAPKQVVASRLAIKPETLSRIMARLRGEGLIEVEGNHIRLIDREALRRWLEAA